MFGIGYIPKAPGTFGSLAGVVTAFLAAIFFLHPRSVGDVFSLHPLTDTILRESLFGAPGTNVHNAALAFPLFALSTIHGLTAGTDGNGPLRIVMASTVGAVAVLTWERLREQRVRKTTHPRIVTTA